MKKNEFLFLLVCFVCLFQVQYVYGAVKSADDGATKTLTGTVTDELGQPIEKACLKLKSVGPFGGQTFEVYTDTEGKYSIQMDARVGRLLGEVSAEGHASHVFRGMYPDFAGENSLCYVVVNGTDNPVRDIVLYSKVYYKKDQRATIILPVAPDPTLGRYYRLCKRDNDYFSYWEIVFEREYNPEANVPYVIFPNDDFELNVGDYDLGQSPGKIVLPDPDLQSYELKLHLESTPWCSLVGTYQNTDAGRIKEVDEIVLLDETPDCGGELNSFRVGAMRAYILQILSWPKITTFVFPGEPTGIAVTESVETDSPSTYDLQGRSVKQPLKKGVYIRDGKKVSVK